MFLRELKEPVTCLKGAGPQAAGMLARLGIVDVGGLLLYYPRDWDDRSRHVPLKDWDKGRVCTEATVLAKDWFGFGRMKTLKIHVEDGSARACLVCFNRPFLEKLLPPGTRCRIYGHFYYKYGEIQSSAFEVDPVPAGAEAGGGNSFRAESGGQRPLPGENAAGIASGGFGPILPVYPLTAGLTQGQLRKFIRRALDKFGSSLEDELPGDIVARDGLLRKADAQRAVHFPASREELEQARKTLVYEELFYLEVMTGIRAMRRKTGPARPSAAGGKKENSLLERRLLERLPFSLTPGQNEAIREINSDMNGPFPMARLLQGDVGSGKTLVSFFAVLKAVEDGGQAVIMVPTELLARQHAETAARFLEPLGLRIAFFTGNLKSSGRARLLKALALGEIDIAVGTHALFSRDVIYRNLRLVVVDEQHRFGVTQREAIMAKGFSLAAGEDGVSRQSGYLPDLLMMSATPIPRTLALTVFGDLDVSVIRDLPPGRKPVKTHLAKQSNEKKVYDFVRKELAAGRQAYFVYPLIEGGDENDPAGSGYSLKDAVSMSARLAGEVFPEFSLALLHSRLDDEEKRRTMDAFRRGEIKILAATSVVEVGVDVPNASCMVIEHAERFGLSALHQLRGRVGRGEAASYCFLVYSDHLTDDGKARLKVMLENSDGFIIAEEDLKLRGPGQIAGIEQSGYLPLGIADPVLNAEELARARQDAFAMLDADPFLKQSGHRCVAEVLRRASPFSSPGGY